MLPIGFAKKMHVFHVNFELLPISDKHIICVYTGMLAKISPIITAYINSKFHQQEKIYQKD